jgi:hypothetical protein
MSNWGGFLIWLPRPDGEIFGTICAGAILEVIAVTHGEVTKNGISVQTVLACGLPPVQGDRVHLHQVIL